MSFKEWYLKRWHKVPKPIRQFINKIDDPIDWVKEWFYNEGEGRRFWKWQIYFDCIMMNKTAYIAKTATGKIQALNTHFFNISGIEMRLLYE